MTRLVCDRVENDMVTLVSDDGSVTTVPLSAFEKAPQEGDVFDRSLRFLEDETKTRRDRVHSLFQKLKQKGKSS